MSSLRTPAPAVSVQKTPLSGHTGSSPEATAMFSAAKGYWCRLYTWYTSFTSLLTCESKEFNYRVVWKPYRPPARTR